MMRKFIRQKKRNSGSMGMVLLAAVFGLSVVYAALYSVIYMFGSGSLNISYQTLYYEVKNGDGGKFYTKYENGEGTSSPIDADTMSKAISGFKKDSVNPGGNIYMLSTYEPRSADEVVTVDSMTVSIQKFEWKVKTEGDSGDGSQTQKVTLDGPLFNITENFKIQISGNNPSLAIDGNELESAGGAFEVSNNAVLTLENSTSGSDKGTFIVSKNHSTMSGGAIKLTSGSLVANGINFEGNRSVSTQEIYGGAICAVNNSMVELTDCVFRENTARCSEQGTYFDGSVYTIGKYPAYGGAVYSAGSRVDMVRCNFVGNAADVENSISVEAGGGAVYINGNSSGSMSNCTVTGNQISCNTHRGAGVYVAAGNNAFALGGKMIIQNNSCYYLDAEHGSGTNVNDNLYLEGFESNISIDTSELSSDSIIGLSVRPSASENENLKALISDSSHKASSKDYFKSDIGGFAVANEDTGLYLIASPEYDELWYGEKNVPDYDDLGNLNTSGAKYKSFFTEKELRNDTGFAYLSDAVAAANSGGTIHMLTAYKSSSSETVNVPASREVTVVRDESFTDTSMFEIMGGSFTVNAPNADSSITFDGKNVETAVQYGGAFYVNGDSEIKFTLNGADKTGGGKTIAVQNNIVSFADDDSDGGGIYIKTGTNSLSNCSITGNKISSSDCDVYGGGIYLGGGTNKVSDCLVTNNTASAGYTNAYGGGVYIGGRGTNTLTNCSITGNDSTAVDYSQGGGICALGGTNTLDSCSVTGNTASSEDDENYICWGGAYIGSANTTMLGTMNITGNTNKNGAKKTNLYVASSYTVALSDGSGSKLDTSSQIGVTTGNTPAEGSPVNFAKSATQEMKNCFNSDNSDYVVRYSDGGILQLAVPIYSNLWYKADDSGTKRFFEGESKDALTATDITEFKKAVECMAANGTIHMLTQYASSSDEVTAVPAGKNITVVRDESFTDASMFKITGGNFIINATDATSSLTFDGNNVSPTSKFKGGAFYVEGSSTKFTLNGAEKTSGGKTIVVQNNMNSDDGGAMFILSGAQDISNCSFSGNQTLTSHGGVIRVDGGTNTMTNCAFDGNTANYGGALAFAGGTNTITGCVMRNNVATSSGGAVDDYSGKNTYTDCVVENNICNGKEGGGFCVNNQSTKDMAFAGKMVVRNNTASGKTCNAYFISGKILNLASNFSAESSVGVTTYSTPVQIATGATEDDMVYCFTSDKGYNVYKFGTDLYVSPLQDDIYQSDNKFYLDAGKTKLLNIKTMAQAVKIAKNIHMLSSYRVTSSETLDIPSGKDVKVVRESSFNNNAMILAITGSFTVNATDTTSSITFDGNNVTTTISSGNSSAPWTYGSIFHVLGNPGITLTLNGAEKSDKSKTINVVNSNVSGGDTASGSAIRNNGTSVLTHCNVSNNKIASGAGSAAAGISNFGALTMENCIVSNNENTANISGGIYTGSSAKSATFRGCTISGNISGQYGGGMYLNSGGTTGNTELKNIVENCTVINNKAGSSSVNGYGGGIYVCSGTSGTTTITGTTISGNDAIGGGGLYIIGGTNSITSCTIKENIKSGWGGGVRIDGGTNTFEGCSITGNTASSRGGGFYFTTGGATTLTRCTISGNTSPMGAGLYSTKNNSGTAGTVALAGATSITGNTLSNSSTESNLCVGESMTVEASGLTDGSDVGISTEVAPDFGAPVTFGTNANETIKEYFKADDSDYKVILSGSDLQLGMNDYNELWYKADDSGTKKFFKGSSKDALTATSIMKFSDAVPSMTANGTIHMLASYESSSDETTDVPAGKNIAVVRDESFTDTSMFKITDGKFEVNATDATSSLTFDGKNIKTTVNAGGVFCVDEGCTGFELNGAEKTDGEKTIALKNSSLCPLTSAFPFPTEDSGDSDERDFMIAKGGAVCIKGGGINKLTNCSIINNTVDFNADISVTMSSIVGGGIFIDSNGTSTLESCVIEDNAEGGSTDNHGSSIPLSYGGGVYIWDGTNTLTNCSIAGNNTDENSLSIASGVYLHGGANTLTNCSITGNVINSSYCLAGGIYISGGTNTLDGCRIADNTLSPSSSSSSSSSSSTERKAGGVCLNSGTNTLSNCSITGNTVSAYYADGGGIYINGGTNTFDSCSITDNTLSDYSSSDSCGGGIYLSSDETTTMIGTMNITGNKNKNGDESNLYCYMRYTVTLSDDSSKLDPSSQIGVTTYNTPTERTPVKFAGKGDETMEQCFTSDNSSYIVLRKGTDFYLSPPFSNLYYKDGKFYSDSGCTTDTGMTKLSETMAPMASNGTVHMLSQYASSSDETIDVPAGKNIAVVRESSFTNASMFSITGGNFTINAPNADSSITFDGKNVSPTAGFKGGAFYVDGSSTKFTLNGAEKTDGGKTIVIQNNKLYSGYDGGGVYINGGTNTLTNCSITGNTVDWGGGVRISGGTNTLDSCSITGNTANSGGGVYIYDGTNTLTNCSMTGNTASNSGGGVYIRRENNTLSNCNITGNTVSSSSSAYGGGVYLCANTTMLGTMDITGNTNGSGTDSNLNISNGCTVALTSDSSKLDTSSQIGLMDALTPTAGTNVQFATGATTEMKNCFTPDADNEEVVYENGNLYLKLAYDNLYYKNGSFYSDSGCTANTNLTKLSDAVKCIKNGVYTSLSSMSKGKIYFKSKYSHSDETVTVLNGYKIAMVRDTSSFGSGSLLDINGQTIKILVPDANSNLIIDGGSNTTTNNKGGLFCLGDYAKNDVTLQGADAEHKNLTIQNFYIDSLGGALRIHNGSTTIKYCNFINNRSTATDSNCKGGVMFISGGTNTISDCYFSGNQALVSHAGAIRTEGGTNTITNCTFDGNKAKYGGALAFNGGTNNITGCVMRNNATVNEGAGGAVDDYNGVNTYTDCVVENNTCDATRGGGFCVNNQSTNNMKFAGKMVVRNNTASGKTCNAYFVSGKLINIASNFSLESSVGVTTATEPNSSSSVQIAKGVTDSMASVKYCFDYDPGTYKVYKSGEALYVGNESGRSYYSNLYYYGNTFYTDEDHSISSGITTLKDAIVSMNKDGTIYMLTPYSSSGGEQVVVPPNLGEIKVVRDIGLQYSMFSITGGSFEICAPHSSSTLIFDGKSIRPTADLRGGVFYVGGDSTNLKISGAEDTQNIILQNNRVDHGVVWSTLINHGGAIYFESEGGSLTCNNCIMRNNAASMRGGAVCVVAGTNSFKNCTMDGNSKVKYGGGFASMGTAVNTFENCSFTNNSSSDYGGNLLLDDGTSTFTNCTISGGSTGICGGGAYCTSATVTFKKCSVTGNKSSSRGGGIYFLRCTNSDVTVLDTEVTGNTASSNGGGIQVALHENQTEGKLKLSGATKVKSNTAGGSANNVNFDNDQLIDVSGLSRWVNAIGVKTSSTPTASSPVKFATGATEEMVDCFSADNSAFYVIRKDDSCLYLTSGAEDYSDVYFKDGKFYSDASCTNFITDQFSKAVERMNSSGTIHMLSQYASSSYEFVDVPAGKNIAVVRDESFTNASMFKITGGNFTVNAPNADSSITFDGKNVSATAAFNGGAFYVEGSSTNFTLNGAEKTDGGKTIVVQNNKLYSNYDGGGVYIYNGTSTLTNCSITGNTANKGGGVYLYGETNTMLGTMNITGNTNRSGTNSNLYVSSGYTVALTSGSSKLDTSSQIGVSTESTPTESTDVQFAKSATAEMKNCFTLDSGSSSYEIVHESGNLYVRVAPYDTIYVNESNFYSDSGLSKQLSITTLSRAVKIAKQIVFKGRYTVSSNETVRIPAGKEVTLLRNSNFTDYSTIDITGGILDIGVESADSKLIINGNEIDTTGAKGALCYIDNNSNHGIYISGYSSSNKNIEIKNFHTTLDKGHGGAICNIGAGTIHIENCKFSGNIARNGRGGSIYSGGSSAGSYVKNCDFYDNYSQGNWNAGAIFISGGNHEISNCYFSGNQCLNGTSGAVCFDGGTNTMTNCTFENNKADWGGAVSFSHGTNTMTNCTVKNNTATTYGGGIYTDGDGGNKISNCTVTGNTAPTGGGMYVNSPNNVLFGTINITGNTASTTGNDLYLIQMVSLKNGSTPLSTDSKINLRTSNNPTSSSPIKFATNATSAMLSCFTSSDSSYKVTFNSSDSCLYYSVK